MYSTVKNINLCTLFLLTLLLTACLGSTGTNESCEDHDRQANAAYLEEHAQQEGVVVTDNGLQYRILDEADGPKPTNSDSVRVEFVGRFIDGTIFDTTSNLPNGLDFRVKNFTLQGIREGLQLMEEGSTYEFVIPSNLGFGETASGNICPGTTLIFELTLVDIFE